MLFGRAGEDGDISGVCNLISFRLQKLILKSDTLVSNKSHHPSYIFSSIMNQQGSMLRHVVDLIRSYFMLEGSLLDNFWFLHNEPHENECSDGNPPLHFNILRSNIHLQVENIIIFLL